MPFIINSSPLSKRTFYVGGVKGVGKTSLINSITDNSSDLKIIVADPGNEMLAYLRKKTEERYKRDSLQNMPLNAHGKTRVKAFDTIFNKNRNFKGLLVFDGHYAISHSFGHEYSIPKKFLDQLGLFILVESSPQSISSRRNQDNRRSRPIRNLEEIRLDTEVERCYAEYASRITGNPLYIIQNDDFEQASAQLIDAIKSYLEIVNNEKQN